MRQQTFKTAIIERYRRRESSVEEALIEMYLSRGIGASGRGHHGGIVGHASVASTVSDLNKKIYGTIEAWRNCPIEGEHPLCLSRYRNIFSHVPSTKVREIAAMRSTPAIAAAREKAIRVIEKLRGLRLSRAAERWWKWRSRERSPTMFMQTITNW
jgi:hypothetical protein